MAGNPKQPEIGEFVIDASDVKDFVKDYPPEEVQKIQRSKPGIDEVLQEINNAQAAVGAKAGIKPEKVAELNEITQKLAKLKVFYPALQKLKEMFDETQAALEDRREKCISAVALQAETSSKTEKDPSLQASYEKTRKYRSAAADKAAQTEKKNKKRGS